ncbi:hypothetical protein VX159_09755 [Dechloromonas sp. ZY10]|uniref:hypothetical protein n=1 Tax=Dechloromonas aquae TaxID=2664436 RepID=UPI0035276893
MHAKTLLTVVAALLALNLPLRDAHAHAEHGQAQFGGVVAEAGEAQFEIVGKDGKITVHVSDHGKPVATAGASGKLSILAGAEKSDVELKPAGDNRLSGQGAYVAGAKLLLQVQLPGKKPLQARTVAK